MSKLLFAVSFYSSTFFSANFCCVVSSFILVIQIVFFHDKGVQKVLLIAT
jgi:hypothetical protein